jgi:hypothetical protein
MLTNIFTYARMDRLRQGDSYFEISKIRDANGNVYFQDGDRLR